MSESWGCYALTGIWTHADMEDVAYSVALLVPSDLARAAFHVMTRIHRDLDAVEWFWPEEGRVDWIVSDHPSLWEWLPSEVVAP